jgi:hypothetical protein
MKKSSILGLIASLVVLNAVIASAHTACCEAKACPAGQTAVPGATPAAAQCCTADLVICTPAPNAGWSCVSDPQENVAGIPDRQAVAGCVQVEMEGVPDLGECVGGAVGADGPAGCVGLGAAFIAGMNPGATAEDCTNAAVDACCAHGACYVAPPDSD